MPTPTLAETLRAAEDATLRRLLRARPDLATPPPSDTAVLATRAATRASVARACEGLDAFTLKVLEALLVIDADTAAVAAADLDPLLGPSVSPEQTAHALHRLREIALVWGDANGISVIPTTRDAMPPYPGGLARRSPALESVDLSTLLRGLPESERGVLVKLAEGPPVGRTRDAAQVVAAAQARTPIQRLLAMNLLLRKDSETVELPRQVALLLRGDHPIGMVAPEPQALATKDTSQSGVDSNAAAEAARLCRELAWVLESWSAEPPAVLRSGGIGVRELRRISRELDVDERRTTLLLELLLGADLIAVDAASDPGEWVPTTHVDAWLAAATEQRWAVIAMAWLRLPRLPGLAGLRDAKDRPLAVLTDDLHRPLAPAERHRVLTALGELDPGVVATDVDELVALLAWRAPRRGGRLRDELVRCTVEEAIALGVAAPGTPHTVALSTAGRTLLTEGAEGAAAWLSGALPEPIEHVLVQADLTVVAPGPLRPWLASEIALTSDVESTGSATVYRIGEHSVRRALDAGRTAAELHELFRAHSATPVPQSLTYLIDDVARRHGQLRGGVAGSFLRCDHAALLAEVLASPVATRCELRRIASTVVISPLPLMELLDGLRAAGFTPAAEGADGSVLDLRPSGRRTTGRSRSARQAPAGGTISEDQLAAAVRQARAGDRAATTKRGTTVSLDASAGASAISGTLALLQAATRASQQVWLGLVDSRGSASQHVITPSRVGGGVVEGLDADGDPHRFPLHLVTSVAVVEPT
ncbi:MAG: helicase-associated domain-containing protein [Sciscionella sp.]